jgi:hypothetical protein
LYINGKCIPLYCTKQINKMTHKEKIEVQKVVSEMVIDQISEMIGEMSNQDFIERVYDYLTLSRVDLDYNDPNLDEEVKEIVGEKVIPLIIKMTEFLVEKK